MQTLVLADIPPNPPKGGCAAEAGTQLFALVVVVAAVLAGRALGRRRRG